uniref:ZP domain-containing protein n=1 Tax=Ascaris lumbricoides TaxID=6252 RepID=A0A0M3II15_ASCLU
MIRFGSGSYSVRDSERLNPETVAPPIYRTIVCTVHFLDDTERKFEIDSTGCGLSARKPIILRKRDIINYGVLIRCNRL